MLWILQLFVRLTELAVVLPLRIARLLFSGLMFNPRLGRLRFVTAPVLLYVLFALALTYVYAPIRGLAGQLWLGKVLRYADERSLGTAIYDAGGRFVGILDPMLDSEADFNYTGRAIELPGYIAYPDHKSLHVAQVPEHFWRCLRHQEDRHLGTFGNPFGIDLLGVLKIPYSAIERSLAEGSPALGAGGSTLAMQLARVFVKRPPDQDESAADKFRRKLTEWWLAPVIQRELTREGIEPMQRWAANHLPLAQRTGGQALYGVELTSLVVFGKPSAELTIAEQYVLAAAVNRPVILLQGSATLNAIRQESWRHVAGRRAAECARALIDDPARRAEIRTELARLAAAPPDPQPPEPLAELVPPVAGANPIRRTNTLMPASKYGVREELKARFGFGWRAHAREVHLSLDVGRNLLFRDRVQATLERLEQRFAPRIDPRYSLDVAEVRSGRTSALAPDIVIAAADRSGAIVRYFESNHTAAYLGSALARDPATGRYDSTKEARFIASVAKMAGAVAIANDGTDLASTGYVDAQAPPAGLETCATGEERRLRRAEIAFACSLNAPIQWRLERIGSDKLARLAAGFGLVLPPGGPPLAKALTIGQMAASPRNVHRMAGAILAALIEDGGTRMPQPSLIQRLGGPAQDTASPAADDAVADLIEPRGRALLRALLSAPLCYRHGTLRRLGDWCAERRDDVRLHFAKTGTRGTGALDEKAYDTVDLWVAGGIQFQSGAAYSYVVLVGTGDPHRPWARDLYAGAVIEPLLRVLLEDLERDAASPHSAAAAPVGADRPEEE